MTGIQGHPEFTPAYSSALMDGRRDRIPTDRISEAMALLNSQPNNLTEFRASSLILEVQFANLTYHIPHDKPLTFTHRPWSNHLAMCCRS